MSFLDAYRPEPRKPEHTTEFRKDLQMRNDVRYALAQLKDAQELLEMHLAALTAQHAEKHKA